MPNDSPEVRVLIASDAARYVQGLTGANRATTGFAGNVRAEFSRIKSAAGDLRSQLAAVGLSFVALQNLSASAKMDKSLTRIGQTAGVSKAEVAGLRAELFRMSADTGRNVDDLQEGFDAAVQAGLNFKEAVPVLDATNMAMAVTNANARSLTGSLTVASTAFDFDLSKPNMALGLLDKMTVAGRLGNAELENLSDIFSKVGVNAGSAGFSFEQTLGFIEGLSGVERQSDRLGTLADSTLRVFTNLNYMKAASKATGVKFFGQDGSRRDPIAVMKDLKREYDKLKTDKDRSVFVQKAFGKADLDTIKGMKAMFSGDMLAKTEEFTGKISNAGGTLKRDLPEAINNAADATARLKTRMREAADSFTTPFRAAFTDVAGFLTAKKEDGGLDMSGKDMLLGALGIGGTALAGGALWRILRGQKGVPLPTEMLNLGGDAAALGKNLAVGKTLQAAAGVTPVFVVNMPGGGMGGGSASPMPSAPTIPPGSSNALILAGASGAGAAALMYLANKSGEIDAKRLGIDPSKRREFVEAKQQSSAREDSARGTYSILQRAVADGRMSVPTAEKALAAALKGTDLQGKLTIEVKGAAPGQIAISTQPGKNLGINVGGYMPEVH